MFLLNTFEYVLDNTTGQHPSDRKCETLINYVMEMKFDRSRPEVFSASSPPENLWTQGIQRRALKIIYPDLSYADALNTTRYDTLIDRRGDACKSFVQKLKGHKSTFRNPLVNILKETLYEPVHNYWLRNSNPPAPLIFTERFRNFVTIKYNS
jgi:hypothetical protein